MSRFDPYGALKRDEDITYEDIAAEEGHGCLCGSSEDVGWRAKCPRHGDTYRKEM